MTECPFNYVKSADGSVCQLRTYLLNKTLVYFPFAAAAAFVILVCVTGYFVTKRKSLIISNSIALLGLIEEGALIYQLYQAYYYKTNYIIITLSSLGVLISLLLINISFVVFYCTRI